MKNQILIDGQIRTVDQGKISPLEPTDTIDARVVDVITGTAEAIEWWLSSRPRSILTGFVLLYVISTTYYTFILS